MCVKYPPCRQSAIVLSDPRVKIKSCALFTFSCCSASLCHSSWNKVGQSWRQKVEEETTAGTKLEKIERKSQESKSCALFTFSCLASLSYSPLSSNPTQPMCVPQSAADRVLELMDQSPLVTSCAKVDSLDLASIFYWPFFYWPGCHFGCGKGRWCAGLDKNCDEGRNWQWEGWNWVKLGGGRLKKWERWNWQWKWWRIKKLLN